MKLRVLSAFVLALFISRLASADTFTQTNLVSDGFVAAANLDPNLKNPWGIAFAATSPFWVANNGGGTSTLYNSAGVPQGLVVTIPSAVGAPSSTPTGVAFNNNGANFHGDIFLFATEEGTVAGWRGGLGTTAEIVVSPIGVSNFTGLAIAGNNLYVADFGTGTIKAFDSNFGFAPILGTFTDPTLPSGFKPFNIQNIGGLLYVTYGKSSGAMLGDGFVDVFDANGNFIRRLVSGGAGSMLYSPWGMAVAPLGFGTLGGDLLVGNFGNGEINAFDSTTGAYIQTLTNSSNSPIVNASLWGLTFGNGGNGGDPNKLYFAAGLDNEAHGLFGSLTNDSPSTAPVPEPGSLLLIASGIAGVVARKVRR